MLLASWSNSLTAPRAKKIARRLTATAIPHLLCFEREETYMKLTISSRRFGALHASATRSLDFFCEKRSQQQCRHPSASFVCERRRQLLQRLFPPPRNELPAHRHCDEPPSLTSIGSVGQML